MSLGLRTRFAKLRISIGGLLEVAGTFVGLRTCAWCLVRVAFELENGGMYRLRL